MVPEQHHRYLLLDELGYFRSYKTYRRAMQACSTKGMPGVGFWRILDTTDNSVSIVGIL